MRLGGEHKYIEIWSRRGTNNVYLLVLVNGLSLLICLCWIGWVWILIWLNGRLSGKRAHYAGNQTSLSRNKKLSLCFGYNINIGKHHLHTKSKTKKKHTFSFFNFVIAFFIDQSSQNLSSICRRQWSLWCQAIPRKIISVLTVPIGWGCGQSSALSYCVGQIAAHHSSVILRRCFNWCPSWYGMRRWNTDKRGAIDPSFYSGRCH